MEEQLQRKAIGDILAMGQKTISYIPAACQSNSMNADDNRCIHNENMNWLTERGDRLPIWSRLKPTNCLGQNRNLEFTKQKHYDIEIPNRLFSIFGTPSQQKSVKDKMLGMEKYQLVNCCLALCAALKYNLNDWSPRLLDSISNWGADLYGELLTKLSLTNDEFNLKYINNLYHFDKTYFRVLSHQVATGFLYIRYGLNEFNLARALTWFFRIYQFGIINCYNRTIAFGFNVDEENGFFMYDCQSKGAPLFEDNETNSYILRTNHLQVLLYCLIISLNVSMDRIKFYIYNVDVRIEDPQEKKKMKKQVYIPTITTTTKRVVQKKIDNGTRSSTTESEDKKDKEISTNDSYLSSPTKSVTIENSLKLNNDKSSTSLNDKTMRSPSPDVEKVLPSFNAREQSPSTYDSASCSIASTSKHSAAVKVKFYQPPILSPQQQQLENKSPSQSEHSNKIPPLAPPKPKTKPKTRLEAGKVELDIASNPNPLGLKVYLVDNRHSCNPFNQAAKKIKVVSQQKDLF